MDRPQVTQQKRRIHQERLALRVLRTGHRARGHQAWGERLIRGSRTFARGTELRVQCHQLHLVAHLAPLHHESTPHLAGIQATLAQGLGHVVGEQEGLVQLRDGHFQPHPVIFAPQWEKALLNLGIAGDFCKGSGRTRVRRTSGHRHTRRSRRWGRSRCRSARTRRRCGRRRRRRFCRRWRLRQVGLD